MAVNYSNLFTDIGKFIKSANRMHDSATGNGSAWPALPTLRDEINDTLNTNDSDNTLDGINTIMDAAADSMASFALDIANKVDERLKDQTTVIDELVGVDGGSAEEIIEELFRAMTADNESFSGSTVTLGTPTADASNVGNGDVLLTKVLDGFSPPITGKPASIHYAGLDSHLAVPSESVLLRCTADASANQTPDGEEAFLLTGQQSRSNPFGWSTEGSGESVPLFTDNAYNLMTNRNFEIFSTSGVPSNWTAKAGLAGTDFAADNDLANVYRGASSLKLINDTTLEQTIPIQALDPRRMYRISFRNKSTASAGNVFLRLYSAKEPFLFSGAIAAEASFDGNWNLTTIAFVMPASIPDDTVFQLSSVGLNAEAWIDSLSFAPVTYAGGVGYSILAGSDDFQADDRFKVSNTNVEGTFQRFFRRKYGMQLPSSGAPTLADSLAS